MSRISSERTPDAISNSTSAKNGFLHSGVKMATDVQRRLCDISKTSWKDLLKETLPLRRMSLTATCNLKDCSIDAL
ncbi:unnamed protein product [Pleuronectes platessa]|uniref:Uncharacterized protein n=1 Tax=Pleuronectes platessa TaxID=8262 RepID=A0A9N7U9M5_PLEPL|nr:unnamed protein product [Pleuronectes platessa]